MATALLDLPGEIAALEGNPEAIRASGQQWRFAAMNTALAATQVAASSVIEGFTGDEATQWADRLRVDTADQLTVLASARDIVGGALVAYADELEACQRELSSLTVNSHEARSAVRRAPDSAPAADLLPQVQLLQALHSRSVSVLTRHAQARLRCVSEIARAAALAPSRVMGVAGLRGIGRAGLGSGFPQPMSVQISMKLLGAARLSAIGGGMIPDPGTPDGEPIDWDAENWLPQDVHDELYNKIYDRCMAVYFGDGASLAPPGGDGRLQPQGISDEGSCIGIAETALLTRRKLLETATNRPELLVDAKTRDISAAQALAESWQFIWSAGDKLTDILFSGCKKGGNVGACLFDMATMFFPVGKAAKAAAKMAEEAVDVARGEKVAEAGADAGKAAKAEKDAGKADEAAPSTKSSPEGGIGENGAPLPKQDLPPLSAAGEAQRVRDVQEALAPGGVPIGSKGTGRSARNIRVVGGGEAMAKAKFELLARYGKVVENTKDRVRVLLPDGGVVQYRTRMHNSPGVEVTIDVTVPGVPNVRELKFVP